MKTTKFALIIVLSFAISANLQAQFLEKLAKKAQKTAEKVVEKRTEKRVEKTVNDVFDKTEEGIDNTAKSDDKQTTSTSKTKKTTTKKETTQNDENTETTQQEIVKPTLTWSKYDFVPGSEIIFEDNLEGEQNGEFPSKWDLKAGTVEIANLNGENVIWFRKGDSKITPLIKVVNYLPEEFTIEFDYQMLSSTQHHYQLHFFGDNKRETSRIDFGGRGLGYHTICNNSNINGEINAKFTQGWKHAAISFNKRALKVYVDDQRVLNIPNIDIALKSFSIKGGLGTSATEAKSIIKNIRVAKGAVPLYDKLLTDGKFVTTGIKFDVNKSTIKAESTGTINYVVKMMQDHPELKFSVEGHTDSDGDNASNLSLSQKRAEAVKNALIKQGIDAERLTSKGWGESKPMTKNDTPEGKAQNRRVEFIKQ